MSDHDSHDRGIHDHGWRTSSTRALVLSLGINTLFFLVVLAGAVFADSVTLLAEAAHMLTDSVSLVLALVAARVVTREPDANRTYGYHRAEVLGGAANALLLLGVVGYVLYEAVSRFRDPHVVNAEVVIVIGVVGLAANLGAAWVLTGHRSSLNVEGAFLHLVADAFGSVAAIALGVALRYTELYVLDPVFAVLIAGLVLYSVKDLLADSLNILLQGTPRDVDVDELADTLRAIDGVEDVHDLHIWAIDSDRTALSAHVVVADATDSDSVLTRTREAAATSGIDHATIQIESPDFEETVEMDCYGPAE